MQNFVQMKQRKRELPKLCEGCFGFSVSTHTIGEIKKIIGPSLSLSGPAPTSIMNLIGYWFFVKWLLPFQSVSVDMPL